MSYWFRVRFNLAARSQIMCDESRIVLNSPGENRVVIGPAVGDIDRPITEAKELSISGQGYLSKGAAYEAARQWRDCLLTSFARLQIGSDFGDRLPTSWMSDAIRRMGSEQIGREIRNDVFGLEVFDVSDGSEGPVYFSASAAGSRPNPAQSVAELVHAARRDRIQLNDRQLLAHDLFGGSFFQPSPDARFVMLAMAIEALIRRNKRDGAVIKHIDNMVEFTDVADIPVDQRDPIKNFLRSGKEESIGQAGARLVSCLEPRLYMNGQETPTEFFKKVYRMRSTLVHGNKGRPSFEAVSNRGSNLELFVADLLVATAISSNE